MFLHPGAVGAAVGARSAWRRRHEDRILHRAIENEVAFQLYERTPVLIMKVRIGSASLQTSMRKKGLRMRLGVDSRELLVSQTTKAKPDEAECALFEFNIGTQFILQGDEVLCFEVLQPHPIFPSKTVGKCLMSLSEVREALGGGRLTQTAGQPLLQELLLCVPNKLPEEILGSLQVLVQLEQSNLAVAMRDEILSRSMPEALREPRRPLPMHIGAGPSYPYGMAQATSQQIPMGTVVGESAQPAIRTADGGFMSTRSWVDPVTGQVRYEAILTDAAGNVVERVEWADGQD